MPINRVSTPQLHFQSIAAMQAQQTKVAEAQNQISTGKKINNPADDPVASAKIISKALQRSTVTQYNDNADFTNLSLSNIENQYTSIINGLQHIRDKVIESGSISLSNYDRKTISIEIEQTLEQLLNYANAKVDGKYIFSGAKSDSKSVIRDNSGNYIYQGDESVNKSKISSSIDMVTNHTAKDIFFNINRTDISLSSISGQASITNAATALSNSGLLSALNANEIKINGIYIGAALDDGVSTTDASGSAKALADAINLLKAKHQVIATANSTSYDLGAPSNLGDGVVLGAGEFTINGVQIVGAADDLSTLADTISSFSSSTGVTASLSPNTDSGPNITLTAADGRNIQLQTNGVNGGVDFANFSLNNAGVAKDQVQRGTVTLSDTAAIVIEGSNPSDIGFTANTYTITDNAGTGVLSEPIISEIRPESALSSEKYLVKFNSAGTHYSIYRESNPSVAITDFKTFSSSQAREDAEAPLSSSVEYEAGTTVVVDGVSFNITGEPAANDSFTVVLTPIEKGDAFDILRDFSNNLKGISGDSTRLMYEVGVTLDNLDNILDNVVNLRSSIGIDMNLLDSQKKYNSDTLFLIDKETSQLEDLDMAEAITRLVQQRTSLEAAQRTLARLQDLSLFNFI